MLRYSFLKKLNKTGAQHSAFKRLKELQRPIKRSVTCKKNKINFIKYKPNCFDKPISTQTN
jgi:hypothetical protein